MSKLSRALKDLISSPAARPGLVPAPRDFRVLVQGVAEDARARGLGQPSWLALSAATTFTMNSPESLAVLQSVAANPGREAQVAEFIREIGLKCISFNGIPRTINCLNEFRAQLPESVQAQLSTTPTRRPTTANIDSIRSCGEELWQSIYQPLDKKLVDKLGQAHPDLPVVIINSHYGSLLSDPAERHGLASVGRVLTSLVGITCLRAQGGTGPQVLSHIYGLRKAFTDGSFKQEAEENLQGAEFLATDAGGEWILNTADRIVHAIGEGSHNFARPKL